MRCLRVARHGHDGVLADDSHWLFDVRCLEGLDVQFEVVRACTVSAPGGLLGDAGEITIGTHRDNPFRIVLSVSPDCSRLAVANKPGNDLDLIDLVSRKVTTTVPVGGYCDTALVHSQPSSGEGPPHIGAATPPL
jgi:YVTN family beta-propeller protein